MGQKLSCPASFSGNGSGNLGFASCLRGVPALFSRDFRPKQPPGTPLDRRGPPRTSTFTKNQPRKPILRPSRGTKKYSQTAWVIKETWG